MTGQHCEEASYLPVSGRHSDSQSGTLTLRHANLHVKHQRSLVGEVHLLTETFRPVTSPAGVPPPLLRHGGELRHLQLVRRFEVGQTLRLSQDPKVLVDVLAVHLGQFELHVRQQRSLFAPQLVLLQVADAAPHVLLAVLRLQPAEDLPVEVLGQHLDVKGVHAALCGLLAPHVVLLGGAQAAQAGPL